MSKFYHTFFFLILFSCSEPTAYEKIKSFYEENKTVNGKDFEVFSKIVIINEKGDCISCNNSFAKQMAMYLDDSQTLFVVSGAGLKVDISGFIHSDKENVIWDQKEEFNKLHISERCALIELKNNKIQEVKEITLDNLNDNIHGFFEESSHQQVSQSEN
jgi:hypothetical protein